MEVLKEAYVIQDTGGTYMCAQNTLTPKLYASRRSAETAVDYYIDQDKNYPVGYRIKKVFLVLGDDDGN
jgi:hypothetical protein